LSPESARGLAHSRTLRAFQGTLNFHQVRVRRPSAAFQTLLRVKSQWTKSGHSRPAKKPVRPDRCVIDWRVMPTRHGSIKLFRLFGIQVYLHWSWFLAVYYFIYQAKGYSSSTWSVLECLSLFLIVLMHEFGHSLACRQVGGQANQILLWPPMSPRRNDPEPCFGASLPDRW
jgi:hypothetical protein